MSIQLLLICMKKNVIKILVKSIVFCFVTFFYSSCSQVETSMHPLQEEKTQIEKFYKLGEVHNFLLQNMKENYNYDNSLASLSKDEKIAHVLNFNIDYLDNVEIDTSYKSELKSKMSFYRYLLDATMFSPFQRVNSNSRGSVEISDSLVLDKDTVLNVGDINNLIGNLAYAHEKGMIPEYAFNVISEIIELLEKSNAGLVSDALLERKIDEIINDVNDMNIKEGDLSLSYIAPVLVIARYSFDWWKDNPDAMADDDGKVAPFVYADAAGAIEGVVGYALTTSSKDVTWSGAGCSALAGGALSSIGIGGRVVKFLRGLF